MRSIFCWGCISISRLHGSWVVCATHLKNSQNKSSFSGIGVKIIFEDSTTYCWWFRNPKQPSGMYPKPCTLWDKLPTWCRLSEPSTVALDTTWRPSSWLLLPTFSAVQLPSSGVFSPVKVYPSTRRLLYRFLTNLELQLHWGTMSQVKYEKI